MASFLDTLFGGGAEKEAADKNRALAAGYGTDAQGYLQSGYDTGVTNLNKGIAAYDPLSTLATQYGKAGTLDLDSLGVNGPEGNARATAAFQNNPGYTTSVNAGLDVLNRRREAAGMGTSGNADLDALNFAQNTQNQQFQNWQTNLAGTGTTGANLTGTVAAGQAGGFTNLSNLAGQFAQNQTGVAGNVLGADTSANTLQAQGEASGAKNLLGTGLALGSLAVGGLGGMGGGSFLSSLMPGGSTPTGMTFGGYGGTPGSGMVGGIRYPAN